MKQIRNIDIQKIIQVSISILENEGFDKLSMRNIASKLGIKAASLYNHFPHKTWLVKELQKYFHNPDNRIYNINYELTSWREFLKSFIDSIYNEFMARPYTLELFSQYSSENDFGAMIFEKYLLKMEGFGFSINDAAYISNLIGIYIVGHCTFAFGVKKQKLEAPDSLNIKLHMSDYPLTNQFANSGWFDLDKSYDFAVKNILDGIVSLQTGGKIHV